MFEDRRPSSWAELTLADMALAYRKAKADCFFERVVSLSEEFAEFEQRLDANLERLLSRLRASDRAELAHDPQLLGTVVLVPKKLGLKPKDGQRHVHFSDPVRAVEHVLASNHVTADFRAVGRLPVEFHVLSALWCNLVGHRFDARLPASARASRFRRFRDEGGQPGEYHRRIAGTMEPYWWPYKKWRADGIERIKSALEDGDKVIAATLDLRAYFHRVDPGFVKSIQFQHQLGLGTVTSQTGPPSNDGLTKWERDFTKLIVSVLQSWSDLVIKELAAFGLPTPDQRLGGVPIGVTTSRLISNLLLAEWDLAIDRSLTPVYYGRYVDDIFLVIKDPGTITSSSELLAHVAARLPEGMLQKAPTVEGDTWEVHVGRYQGKSELCMHEDKLRVFALDGRSGLDLLDVITERIEALASERRLMPDPRALVDSDASRALAAATEPGQESDALRKVDGLSLQRMGWAIQLARAETLALDLPSKNWRGLRQQFYQFAHDHVLRADRILSYMDYFPRLVGLAMRCGDSQAVVGFHRAVVLALSEVERACQLPDNKVVVNGYQLRSVSKTLWRAVEDEYHRLMRAAVIASWPWTGKGAAAKPASGPKWNRMLDALEIRLESLQAALWDVREADLATVPLKEHRRLHGVPRQHSGWLPPPPGADEETISVIQRFLDETVGRRLPADGGDPPVEDILPYVFPTRPFAPREVVELDPRCVGLGGDEISADDALDLWAKQVRALKGIWAKGASRNNTRQTEESADGTIDVGGQRRRLQPLIGLANLKTSEASWQEAAAGTPQLTEERYHQIARVVNQALTAYPRPDYLLLPELSLPHRWVRSVSNRLVTEGISLIAGVEYQHPAANRISNEAVLVLEDDRLGFRDAVVIWQPKSEPAPAEDQLLQKLVGRLWWPDSPEPKRRVYRHFGFDFGVMVCSELQDVGFRSQYQGEVDALFVLSWNQDLETFSALVDATALDVHAYTVLVNNRMFGDSRVRVPAKEAHSRDVCRIRGGENDYVVVAAMDALKLRRFQSRARRWTSTDDPFKPVPQGFQLADRRRMTPG